MVVHVMVAAVVVVGYATATRTAREGMPNVSMPMIVVKAILPGAAARDVETKVTIPIEDAIEEVDGVKSFHTVISDNPPAPSSSSTTTTTRRRSGRPSRTSARPSTPSTTSRRRWTRTR